MNMLFICVVDNNCFIIFFPRNRNNFPKATTVKFQYQFEGKKKGALLASNPWADDGDGGSALLFSNRLKLLWQPAKYLPCTEEGHDHDCREKNKIKSITAVRHTHTHWLHEYYSVVGARRLEFPKKKNRRFHNCVFSSLTETHTHTHAQNKIKTTNQKQLTSVMRTNRGVIIVYWIYNWRQQQIKWDRNRFGPLGYCLVDEIGLFYVLFCNIRHMSKDARASMDRDRSGGVCLSSLTFIGDFFFTENPIYARQLSAIQWNA